MNGGTEPQILTYRNALEPFVETEARSQIEQQLPQLMTYLSLEQAIAFAL